MKNFQKKSPLPLTNHIPGAEGLKELRKTRRQFRDQVHQLLKHGKTHVLRGTVYVQDASGRVTPGLKAPAHAVTLAAE